MAKKWIQKSVARMKKKGTIGSLRKAVKAKKGKNISMSKLKKAAKSKSPAMRKKANWAINVRKSRRR